MKASIGWYGSQGAKSYQEDRMVCIQDMKAEPGLVDSYLPCKVSYFAVFDGHGGSNCSTFLATNFHVELGRHPKLGQQPLTALRETWNKMDKLYLDLSMRSCGGNVHEINTSGSTATVCLLVGDEMYMMNCGDSSGGVINKTGDFEILTEDHGTLNASEVHRVQTNGGIVVAATKKTCRQWFCCCTTQPLPAKPRVYPGGLLVTRAFGDFNAKLGPLGGQEGVVIPDFGQIKYKKIDSLVQYIILASDGLWDALSTSDIWRIMNDSSRFSFSFLIFVTYSFLQNHRFFCIRCGFQSVSWGCYRKN
jgi:protein phosphatase 2C family protein 2/3